MSTLTIESSSAEPALVTITSLTDPTGTPPEFQVTARTATSPDGTWTAGTWSSTWESGRVIALTPTIGGAGQLVVTEGAWFTLWIRWGTVVKRAASIIAT